MKARVLGGTAGLRGFAIVFDAGDEAAGGLLAFAREHGITAAAFTGIGALSDVTVGYFEIERPTRPTRPADAASAGSGRR